MDRDDGSWMVNAAIQGDADAIRALWQEHRRWVATILLAHKPRQEDLEDLLQEVAMAFVKKINQLRDEEAFKPWLRTVAINTARAAGRSVTRRKHHDARLRLHTDDRAERPDRERMNPDDREEARWLMNLAMQLPEGYREPLLLRCVQGMSYKRISELTELPETTIETRIARGRRMLRELASSQEKHINRPLSVRKP